jgi:3-mercaptopyruvate sulfurtransferase SseA
LKQKGISRVRPLEGGLNGWREKGYPIAKAAESREREAESIEQKRRF